MSPFYQLKAIAMKNVLLLGLFSFVCYNNFAIFEASSALSKTNSGSDESNSVFTKRGFHPEYSTSKQIQINSDSNKFASDPGKDSTSSGEHVILV